MVDAVDHRAPEPEPDHLRDDRVQLAGGPAHDRERGVEKRGIALAEARVGMGHPLESHDRVRPCVGLRRVELADQLGQVVGDRGDVELLLRGELPVDEPSSDSDGLRDLLDRGVLDAALVEQRTGRGDQIALAVLPQSRPFDRSHDSNDTAIRGI